MRILIVVTHLLGAGHLTRAAALARAFADKGHQTTLVSGGMPSALIALDGVTLVQLPPVRTKGTDFKTLLDERGEPIAESRLAERKTRLFETFHRARPDCVLTELFPFGRRVLADEFTALLEVADAARPRPLIACSIRDILATPTRADRIAETHARLDRFYDTVLVHGDPDLVPLDTSWPVDASVQKLLRYTGYVDDNVAALPSSAGRRGIVVSGGSSAASLPLYRAAVASSKSDDTRPWRILMGQGLDDTYVESIRALAPEHTLVERARPDFRNLLSRAEVSVSQAGYNTVVDLLRSGPFPVLVPFEGGHETEQRIRAERLEGLGRAHVVLEANLAPQTLADAVRRALERHEPPLSVDLSGAQETVALIERMRSTGPALHEQQDWSRIGDALKRARDNGKPISAWWRDDDATQHTPALDRLLVLAERYSTGIALAVVPRIFERSLVDRVADEAAAHVLVHGFQHRNHAPQSEKKAEFGAHRPLADMIRDIREARERVQAGFGARMLPVFVPPWNRIAPNLISVLSESGYRGISTYRDRASVEAAPGLLQVNAHLDPIDWRGNRSLLNPDALIAELTHAIDRRTAGIADAGEPIGLLTHHLVHDEAVWSFCERLLDYLSRNTVRFVLAGTAFSGENGSPLGSGTL